MELYALSTIDITESNADDINNLLKQLSSKQKEYTLGAINKFLKQLNLFVFGVFDDHKIVGMASLKAVETRMFTQNYETGFIGDVVVDSNYRRQGIAEKLVIALIDLAKGLKITHISLTSNPNNPERSSAIKLYEKLGFKKVGELNGSNYYRLNL